jgi:hypothetical protein
MQENRSVTEPAPAQAVKSTVAVQALLRQLLDIYDAKTLANQLEAYGESHWSPAILKRLLTSERAGHRLSDGEYRYLQNLLPRPRLPTRTMLSALSISLPVSAVSGTGLKPLAASACLPVNGTNMPCVPIKRTGTAILPAISLMPISAKRP